MGNGRVSTSGRLCSCSPPNDPDVAGSDRRRAPLRIGKKDRAQRVVTRRRQSHHAVPPPQLHGKGRASLVLLSKLTEDQRGWFATGFPTTYLVAPPGWLTVPRVFHVGAPLQ